jgi:hypothetical protein
MEVNMQERAKKVLVELVGEDIANLFAAQVDDVNKTIRETGMIVRSNSSAQAMGAKVRPVIRVRMATSAERGDIPELPQRRLRKIPFWMRDMENAKEPGSLVEAANSTLATFPAFGRRMVR